jgi:hypothetical protein
MKVTKEDWGWVLAALETYDKLYAAAKEVHQACPHTESPRYKRLGAALRAVDAVKLIMEILEDQDVEKTWKYQ